MIDRRAQILARLEVLLGEVIADLEVEEEPQVFRNRGAVPPDKRPAMVLLDGIEEVVSTHKSPRGGPSSSIVALKPEIYALLKERKPDKATEYASELQQYRNAMITRILYDNTLLGIMGDNGGIIYQGSETDMQSGSTMHGELQVSFVFHYPLIPSELL